VPLWLVFVFILSLSACAQSSDCFDEDVFCVGLMTDTLGIDDHGMNQDTWAGLEEAKANGLVDRAEYIESVDARDYVKNIAYFAEKGYDVIITVNPGLSDETLRSADLYPTSVFIGMNQPQEETRPNLIPVTFPEDQMGFLAGALAARISETQIVGAVCETSGIDSMWRYCEGFRAGAALVNKLTGKNVKASVVYRDDGDREKLFVDEVWGRDTAQGLIQRGADVIFAAGGATGQGALRAASEAGLQSIGAERDQRLVLAGEGSGVITSIFGDASSEVQKVLGQIREGKTAEPHPGQIKYVPFGQKFPENLTGEMDTLLFSLSNGEIKTNVTLKKP
jgi:basic membrane protein A and related proteins